MAELTARVQVLFTPEQFVRLRAIARGQRRSVGALIREAVDRTYFDDDQLSRLHRSGLVRRALKPPNARLLDGEVSSLSEENGLVQALLDERNESR